MKVAREATVQSLSPLKIKKIYVLAALLVSVSAHTHTRNCDRFGSVTRVLMAHFQLFYDFLKV